MKQPITESNTSIVFNPFIGPEIVCIIPITQPQFEIWISCELGGDDANRAYNESVSLILKGNLNKTALEDAIHKLVERHEALRATFSQDGRFMTIFREFPIEPFFQDISELSETKKKNAIKDYLSRDANHIFKLEKGPLLKIGLLKLSELEHQLIITAHHIICDGWSMGIILEELGSFYSAYAEGKTPEVPQPETFSSYVEGELEFIESLEFDRIQKYWLNQYQTSVPTVSLPTDFPRPQIRTFNSNRLDFEIDKNLVTELKKVGIQSGASFVVTLLAAFEVFLYHQTGQNELVIGLPSSGQSSNGKTQLVGHCVNFLPLRSKLAADIPFNIYLKNRKEEIFDAYEHQQFSFGQLLQKLNIARDLSRVPLVPVCFNIDMDMANDVVFNGLSYKLKINPIAFGTFELYLNATRIEDELILEWSYNTSLFKSSTIEQMMATFKEVLHSIAVNPGIEIGNIIKVDNSASLELNDTDASSPNLIFKGTNLLNNEDFIANTEVEHIVDLFLSQVKKTPNNIAVVYNDKKITYRELDTDSNRLANYLIQSQNVLNGDLVGLMLERSEVLIICILGILKTGAAYVPIDINYPERRKNYIKKDSRCKVIIDETLLKQFTSKIESYSTSKPQVGNNKLAEVLYVLYTSGSTGEPKGVCMGEKALINLINWQNNNSTSKNGTCTLQFAPLSFDVSFQEVMATLTTGGTLVLINNALRHDMVALLNFIETRQVNRLFLPFVALQALAEAAMSTELFPESLKEIMTAGEQLKITSQIRNFFTKLNDCVLYNQYGPTECHVVTELKLDGKPENWPALPSIGKPISNTSIFILDQNQDILPNETIGELCITGVCLAEGYLNNKKLTDEKFLYWISPDGKYNRMYRTGDYAKYLPDGNIEFLGRQDDQVKISGHRVELAEVELAINSLSGIRQTVVVALNHLAGQKQLIAYIEPTQDNLNLANIRQVVSDLLPDYMVPSYFVLVEDFPRTSSGKIDKKNLPSPEYIRQDSGTVLKVPQTKLEKEIGKVWSEFLQIPVIDVEDNFFEIGGSSLIAQRVVGLLRKKLNTKIPLINIFQYPTISQLAKFLSENLKVEDESETISNVFNANVTASISNINLKELNNNFVSKKKIGLIINSTKAQSEILTSCFFGGDDAKRAYNLSWSLKFTGKLKYDSLELAIKSLVERHESLRSSFSEDLQLMHIYTDFQVDILYHDISNQGETEKQELKKSLINDDVNYLFDLVNGPLIKFSLVKINELEHELILTVNHAVCDGLSTSILIQELGVLYSAFCQDKIPNLSEPERFSLFAEIENKFADSDEYKRSEEFWLNMYQESIPMLEMPIDYPRPKLRTYNNHHLDFLIDNSILNALKQIGNTAESSIFTSIVTTLVAAFEVFLYQQTGQNDLVLGLTSSRRANYDMMQLVGHTVNLLPLRSKVDTKISFKDYLIQRNTQLFDAYENQSISFGHLLEKLFIPRDPSRVPLVPVIINIQLDDVLESKHSFFNLSTEIKHNYNDYDTFEIELQVFMSNEGPCFRWRYNTTLFKSETIEKMMASFKEVLKGVVANPSVEIGTLIKVDFSAYLDLNDTHTPFPQLPLHELIIKQAQNTPSKQAIKFGDSFITYENLEKKSHQLAHYLLEQGVCPGDFVAVLLPRSIELIVALIAIMECGAAYVPLDPDYPKKRLEFMLKDSETKFMITSKTSSSLLESGAKILFIKSIFSNLPRYPDTPVNIVADNNQVAYLLYTSGSSGTPKGVTVTHKNLVNLLFSVLEKPGIQETDKLLSITTISFDIAGFELYATLLKGAKLILTNEDTAKDPRLLLDVIKDEAITMMEATPATWQMLLDAGWDEYLPIKALCTGEALPMVLAKNILGKVNELWNLYGPTETTIWSAIKKISKDDDLITIGRPIANTKMYIVNEQGHLVEPGNIGELCIAGDGVAKGYWKREELTAEKFIDNPFESEPGGVLYRTGDLAKLLPSGEIQCLGRIDQQIKIRGHRIELGEIEQALDSLEGVKTSVVLLNEDQLVAYLIPLDIGTRHPDQVSAWKQILREQLPAHMVPLQLNLLKEFPKTLNGKIDRKALLNNLPNETIKTSFTPPSTNSEKIISAIWQECLKIDKIDVNSDFFEIGGHSLVGVKVMIKLEKETGKRLPLVGLLKHPTIKKFAAYMDTDFYTWNSLVPLKPEGNKPALYIVHGANHNVLHFDKLAQLLHIDQPVYALQSRGLDGISEPHDCLHKMATDYLSEIIASNPKGPYALAGFSFGGIVAYEMARQLKAQGRKVHILAQFDTYVFPTYYYNSPIKKKIVSALYLLGKMGYLLVNMFSNKKNFKRRVELLKLLFRGYFLRLKYGKGKQLEIQFNVPLKMEINHNLATERYTMVPQDIVIDLFRAKEDVNFVHDYKFLGWKKMAQKGIRKHMVPGNHVDMFEMPNVEDLAISLQNVLDTHNSENYE